MKLSWHKRVGSLLKGQEQMSSFYHTDEKYGSRLPVHSSYLSRIVINDEKKGGVIRK